VIHAVLADTGPLYAAADDQDFEHERAVRQIHELEHQGRRVLLLYPILLEGHGLVLKRFGPRGAMHWLEYAVQATLVNPTPQDYTLAGAILRAFPDQDIRLVDATVATVAQRMKLEVWTYDHHFDVMRVPVWR
jgi:predicted nucleic acid-binding protein